MKLKKLIEKLNRGKRQENLIKKLKKKLVQFNFDCISLKPTVLNYFGLKS